MKRILVISALAAAAAIAVLICVKASGRSGRKALPPDIEVVTNRTVIQKIDPRIIEGSVALSRDCRKAAYAIRVDGGVAAVVDGKVHPAYDYVGWRMEYNYPMGRFQIGDFSSDGKHFAYAARRGGKWVVVRDGVEGKAYDFVEELTFADEGNGHLAYIAKKDGKAMVVVDGVDGPAYDEFVSGWISLESGLASYIAKRDGQLFVVVNGSEGKAYDDIVGPWLTTGAGGRAAYVARRGKRYLVVSGSAEGKEYDHIDEFSLQFSPDGNHLAYVAGMDARQFVVIDGVEGAAYEEVWWTLSWNPDSRRIAYAIKRAGKWYVVADGVEGKGYGNMSNITWSPDGSRLAYCAEDKDGYFIVADGAEGTRYLGMSISNPFLIPWFSADGKHLCYTGYKYIPRASNWLQTFLRSIWLSRFSPDDIYASVFVMDNVEYETGDVDENIMVLPPYRGHVVSLGTDGNNRTLYIDGVKASTVTVPSSCVIGMATEDGMSFIFLKKGELVRETMTIKSKQ